MIARFARERCSAAARASGLDRARFTPDAVARDGERSPHLDRGALACRPKLGLLWGAMSKVDGALRFEERQRLRVLLEAEEQPPVQDAPISEAGSADLVGEGHGASVVGRIPIHEDAGGLAATPQCALVATLPAELEPAALVLAPPNPSISAPPRSAQDAPSSRSQPFRA
jgi:hypothetical protein